MSSLTSIKNKAWTRCDKYSLCAVDHFINCIVRNVNSSYGQSLLIGSPHRNWSSSSAYNAHSDGAQFDAVVKFITVSAVCHSKKKTRLYYVLTARLWNLHLHLISWSMMVLHIMELEQRRFSCFVYRHSSHKCQVLVCFHRPLLTPNN